MPNIAALLAPLALLLPLPATQDNSVSLTPDPEETAPAPAQGWLEFDAPHGVPLQYQIRIEQRVVIRVSPRRPARQNLTASSPRRSAPKPLVERKIGKCINMNKIGAVQPTNDNRLMLYMRDQRLIAANLEKACSARDFYQGFYVEPSKDGKLCIDRDKLQSRTGAKCELSRIRQMIAADTT